MESKSKKDYAYTVLDIKGSGCDLSAQVKEIGEVVLVRVI
jgi:hypothetical protein